MTVRLPAIAPQQFTTFGDLLKHLRRRAGLTQRELSIAVGYSDAQISRLEHNQRLPDLATLTARFIPTLDVQGEPEVVARLLELAATVRRDDAPATGLAPFKGLLYFDEADADLFFGREALTARLVSRGLGPALGEAPAEERFLAIVGASGSGKSSVLRAGVIPALRWNPASAAWPVHVLTPTAHPLEALAAQFGGEGASASVRAALADGLARDPLTLHRAIGQETQRVGVSHALLVVDQFEELFSLCRGEAERRAFVDNLLAAAFEPGGPATVIIALRADFYAHCAAFPSLRAALAARQEYIGMMSADELRRAIEEPAHRGGWELEPGLVDWLLKDVGADGSRPPEPGALPLLSHALLETWERRRGRALTLSGYTATGGVQGAIAETAEAVFNDQLDQPQRAIARRIFLRLTELGEDEANTDTRRRVGFDELNRQPDESAAVRQVLTVLADARLITTEKDTAEVAHEALIREWPTLRRWLTENREALLQHRRLTEAAQEWERLRRDEAAAYRGARLAQALEWAATNPADLNALEHEFLEASRALAEHEAAEREAQRQRELQAARKLVEAERQRAEEQGRATIQLQRRALYLTIAFVLALLMGAAAIFFGEQARRAAVAAQANERIAFSRELAAASISSRDTDPELGLLLALEAVSTTYSVDQSWTAEAEDALRRALLASRVEHTLRGHTALVASAAYSPDGARLATASDDGAAIVWDAASGQALLTIKTGATRGHHGLAFSPDGTRLATASDNGTVKVWDAASGQELLTLRGHTDWVSSVAFSPDGARLATASEDRTAKIWDAASGQVLLTLTGHSDEVWSVAFSPDGARLATASDDGTAVIWDAASGDALQTLRLEFGPVYAAVFSPDGATLATANADRTAKLWDTATGELLATLRGHADIVTNAVFSPDGSRLATASFDGLAKVWDLATGQELFKLAGHTGPVLGLAFSPDCAEPDSGLASHCGAHLATTGEDGTARVWNTTLSQELLTLSIPKARVFDFSPDGTRVAVGAEDGTAAIWDIAAGRELLTLLGHTGPILRVAFSLDGTRLATTSDDQTARLWDTASGQLLQTLRGHTAGVFGAAFSPDGTRLATSSIDFTVKVWDLATGQTRSTLSPGFLASSLAYSPDGARLAAGNIDASIKVWDTASGAEQLVLRGHGGEIWSLAFSPDSRRLVSGSYDRTAKVWDMASGQELLTLGGHTGSVESVAFSPAGDRLATASLDGTAKVWQADTGRLAATLYGFTDALATVAFSADGTRLLTAGGDGTIRVYLRRIEDLTALAGARVTRSFTVEECQHYLHRAQCPAGQAPPPAAFTAAPTAALTPSAAKGKVCEVTDAAGVDDQFFNQIAYQGVQAAAEKFNWEGALLESQAQSDYGRNINTFLSADCDLIVTIGFQMNDATVAAAAANPSQNFISMDVTFDQPLDKVRGQVYATDQAAFLAGYVAASVTRTGKVATYGGINFPAVTDFMDGFALGVAYYNEQHGTHVEVLGWDVAKHDGLFSGNFSSTEDGRRLGEDLLNQGADIILPVAGRVGLGTAAVIQERGGAYLIGPDSDWTLTYPEYAGIVLTSIQKRLDVSVLLAVQAISDGTFTGGTSVGTLATGEVSLAPYGALDSLVTPQVKADLEQIQAGIIRGQIQTRPPDPGQP